MPRNSPKTQSLLKTLLDLGRVSNIPTVWTNCLAGWMLGGGGEVATLIVLCVAGSLVYIGGMYLNDAFDVTWDVDHKNDRPIPAGLIPQRPVWLMGWGMLFAGLGGLATLGLEPAILGAQMTFCVVLYDAIHKKISWSPIIMAACRFFLLLTAVSCGNLGINGFAVWCSVVLAAYIVGLSYIAKAESLPGLLRYWPIVFLASPIVLAVLVNDGEAREKGWVISAILGLWVIKSLKHLFVREGRSIGAAVSGLLAGICLVDLLAVAIIPPQVGSIFLGCFLMCLVLQRSIAAT